MIKLRRYQSQSSKKWIQKAIIGIGVIAVGYNIAHTPGNETREIESAGDRRLSISFGDGTCEWEPPAYEVPENIDFWKTIVVGYPSGDKRLTFLQMEALAGWPAKDEWDFENLGMSNHPFIKANYPHHEGIWGWQDAGDQVVMVVRNIRRSMVEYHDILWDIGYAKTWAEAFELIPNLYEQRPPIEDFLVWRDLRVIDEIDWYGWFIDYWMEAGLRRDIFTHELTTPEHWDFLMKPTVYSRTQQELAFVPTEIEDYDPPCLTQVSGGCQPIKIISAEKLVQHDTGPAENRKIAEVLLNHEGMAEYVIEEVAWECIWTELIVNHKGLKTFVNRPGYTETDYNFGPEMLQAMISQLDRLITKYSAPEWFVLEISRDLVALLDEHRTLIQEELAEVQSGSRKLQAHDFLGPMEREKQKASTKARELVVPKKQEMKMDTLRNNKWKEPEKQDHNEYFDKLHRSLLKNRVDTMRKEAMIEAEYWRRHK